MFFGLLLQSPHDLTAAFPSNARAAVSSCFLCRTHTECLLNQGSRKGLWHFCLTPFGSCTALLLPWKARAGRAGCPAGHPPLCQGSTFFCRTDFSVGLQISDGILQQCFLSGSWALCPHRLLVPLLIVQRASRETADNCPRISQLQQEQTVSNHGLSVLPGH